MSRVCDLDFVWPSTVDLEQIRNFLDRLFKKYAGQPECGEEAGVRHWQIRGSLFGRKDSETGLAKMARACAQKHLPEILESTFHITFTSRDAAEEWRKHGYAAYVEKFDTSIGDVITSDDEKPMFIPWQIRQDLPGEELGTGPIMQPLPWQQSIFDSIRRERRYINCLVDPKGCQGKSTLVGLARVRGSFMQIPPIPDWKELMQIVLCQLKKYKTGKTPTFFAVDVPRALKWDRLKAVLGALESIKEGYAFDPRNTYIDRYFCSPCMWCFTNEMPDVGCFTPDRWKFWALKDGKLVPWSKRKREFIMPNLQELLQSEELMELDPAGQ